MTGAGNVVPTGVEMGNGIKFVSPGPTYSSGEKKVLRLMVLVFKSKSLMVQKQLEMVLLKLVLMVKSQQQMHCLWLRVFKLIPR